jgi:hypothetical protein
MDEFPIVLGGVYQHKVDNMTYTGVMRTVREADGFLAGMVDVHGRRAVELFSNGNGWKEWSYLGETYDDALDGLQAQIIALEGAVATLDGAVAELIKLLRK